MILIDFDLLAHRCYRAMDHLLSSSKQPTGMEYGVMRALKYLPKRIDAKAMKVVLCFESIGKRKTPVWYKEGRKELEKSFYSRKQLLIQQLKQVYHWSMEKGCEADQLLYSLSKEEKLSYILTNDSDLYQAISDSTILVKAHENQLFYWTKEHLFEKEKVWPWQYAFLKTIRGDRTDNIPGILGLRKVVGAEIARYTWNKYAKNGMDGLKALERSLLEHEYLYRKDIFERVEFFIENYLETCYNLINLDKKVEVELHEPGGQSIQSYLDFLEIKSLTFCEEKEF